MRGSGKCRWLISAAIHHLRVTFWASIHTWPNITSSDDLLQHMKLYSRQLCEF